MEVTGDLMQLVAAGGEFLKRELEELGVVGLKVDLAALAEDLRAAGRDDFAVRLLAAADLIKE